MKEIEIDYKPKIFDDPEYCETKKEHCGRKEKFGIICYQFGNILKVNNERKIKCDECKEHYKRAKG